MGLLVPDDWPLSFVSLPGTHNTACYAPKRFVGASRCQTRDLKVQLDMGIRFLDLRVRPGGMLYHGIVSCGITLHAVLSLCAQFLHNHPLEVLIIRLRDEIDSFASGRAIDELVREAIDSAEFPFFLECRLPVLRE
eukprot:2775928-Amphidinium_carterae.1